MRITSLKIGVRPNVGFAAKKAERSAASAKTIAVPRQAAKICGNNSEAKKKIAVNCRNVVAPGAHKN